MKLQTPLIAAAASFLALTACTLLLPFDPEGQKCDSANQCLEGYGCVDGVCKKGAPPANDCAQCPTGACRPGTTECEPPTCATTVCQAGAECVDDPTSGPTCQIISAGDTTLGFTCFDDNGCLRPMGGGVRRCLLNAIPTQTGTVRGGVCVEECGADDTCTTPNAVCRTFPVGATDGGTKVCVPANTLTACSSNATCAKAGLVCTVFDNPALGPVTACDAPLSAAGITGDACVRSGDTSDGGVFCANGLCVAGATGSACSELCGSNGCASGTCAPVGFAVQSAIRYVPMCIPQASNCAACTDDPNACGADAPHCTQFGSDSRCLGGCTPDAGIDQCPEGYECTVLGSAPRCTPIGGACP